MAVTTLDSTTLLYVASAEATYNAAREGTGVNRYVSSFGWIGQYLSGDYEVNQVFASFDLSGLPAEAVISGATLILTARESYGSHTVEVRSSTFTPNNANSFVPGSGLAAKVALGSTAFAPGFDFERQIALTGFTRANLANVILYGAGQRTGVAPTGETATRIDSVKLEVTYTVVETITATGAGAWTVPAGVTTVTVQKWSGGQGGSADRGGRGGNFAQSTITVTPGASVSYSVGAGGNGVQFASNINGGDTWFSSASAYVAKGGGNTSGNVGTTNYYGGAGGAAFQGVAGGGGGSARPTQAGGNASTFDGGEASLQGGSSGSTQGGVYGGAAAGISNTEGGSGGAGLGANAGGAPGGGGGGGSSQGPGGAGGRGQIRITWDTSTSPPAPARRAPRSFYWL